MAVPDSPPRSISESTPHVTAEVVVPMPAARLSDGELLTQLAHGRPAAFQELFDRYAKLVRGAIVRMIGPDGDLDDLVQEALLIVVRRHTDIRDPTALRSFVYSVAVRVCRNELRKRAIRRFIPWREVPEAATAVPPHDPAIADAVRRVHAALERLDADLRVAFVLRFVEGYELAEGAKLAGCSLATYKRRLSRAQKRFHAAADRDPILARWLDEGDRP